MAGTRTFGSAGHDSVEQVSRPAPLQGRGDGAILILLRLGGRACQPAEGSLPRQKLERLARTAADTPTVAAEVRRLDADFLEILRTFDALLQLAEIEGGARPEGLVDLTDVASRLAHPLQHVRTWGVSLVFGALLLTSYVAVASHRD